MKSLLNKIKNLAISSPFYNQVRFNPLSDSLIELLFQKTQKGIDFYSSFLDKNNDNKLIFDIGANKGNKIKVFRKMGFEVIGLEPELTALSTLEYRFKNDKNVKIVNKGVSNQEGELDIFITASRSGLNTLNQKWTEIVEENKDGRWNYNQRFKRAYKVKVITLQELIEQFGIPYFIKIDVEGLELNVIKGLHKLPPFISFECNLPEFKDETLEIIERISDLNPLTTYQYSINDSLVAERWLKKNEIMNYISQTSEKYLEIISKS